MCKSITNLKRGVFLIFILAANLGYAQTIEKQIQSIQKKYNEINADTTYRLRSLDAEQLASQSFNGAELVGSYQDGELKKTFFDTGKSNGIYYTEYYYSNNELFFAFEIEKQFYYNTASGEWDYDSIPRLYEASYYYVDGELIEARVDGTPFDGEVFDDSIVADVHMGFSLKYAKILSHAKVKSKAYDIMLTDLLDHSVSEVLVGEIDPDDSTIVYLDAREYNEYKVSHIEGAIWVGYDDFDMNRLDSIQKSDKIVVYCSVGYRSEKVSEKLVEANYENVSNMYGSIFEWVNQGRPVYDKEGNETTNVHAFNKEWGRWLKNGIKVY